MALADRTGRPGRATRVLTALDGLPLTTHLPDASTQEASARLTLHEAMRAQGLAQTITSRNLYRMRDGRPAEAQQIHARVGHHPDLFKREGTFIKLVDVVDHCRAQVLGRFGDGAHWFLRRSPGRGWAAAGEIAETLIGLGNDQRRALLTCARPRLWMECLSGTVQYRIVRDLQDLIVPADLREDRHP